MTKITVSIVFLAFLMISVLSEPITMKMSKISGKDMLRKTGRYDSFLEQKYLSKAALFASQPIYGYFDEYYVGDIYIGTPQQHFSVLIDVTNSQTYVAGISCTSAACTQKQAGIPPKNLFDPTKSTTYIAQNIPFSDVSVRGSLALDTLTFGGLSVNNETIGIASYLPDELGYYAVDGILGLGWSNLTNSIPTLDRYLSQLPQNMFTLYFNFQSLSEHQPLQAGQVTYGGLDTIHCSANIQYVPLYQAGFPYWQFIMNGYQYGTYFDNSNRMAVIDTRVDGIIMPSVAYDVFRRQSGGFIVDGDLVVYCNQIASMPDIIFTINKVQYRVSSANYVPNFPGRTLCGVEVYEGFTNDNKFYFGDAWLRTVCNVFDVKNKQIGFAAINNF